MIRSAFPRRFPYRSLTSGYVADSGGFGEPGLPVANLAKVGTRILATDPADIPFGGKGMAFAPRAVNPGHPLPGHGQANRPSGFFVGETPAWMDYGGGRIGTDSPRLAYRNHRLTRRRSEVGTKDAGGVPFRIFRPRTRWFASRTDIMPGCKVNWRSGGVSGWFAPDKPHLADMRVIPVALRVVDAVAHDKLVGDLETRPGRFHVNLAA